MADQGQRTEKPTQRRLERARREGNFPSSREFLSPVQFIGFVALATTFSGAFLMRTARIMQALLARAFTMDITAASLTGLVKELLLPEFTPLIAGGAILFVLAIAAQLATTRMGISLSKLAP